MMLKLGLTLILLWLAMAPAIAGDAPNVIFDRKYFTDRGGIVNIEGSPTGKGVSPDTNRWVLWCYQERRECLQIIIIANGTFISLLTPIPIIYSIKIWAPDRIVAQRDLACGLQETWLLDRLREKAEFFGATCLGKKPATWTIEDPPALKKLMEEKLGDKKLRELLENNEPHP
jgi:hypothetical protein